MEYDLCENLDCDRYISKSYTTTKNTIDWQYTEQGLYKYY